MTTTVMSALAVIYNHDDRRILADFGKGAKVADIAGGLGFSNERVLSVVNRINMNQSTAREAVRYYDKQMATSAGKAAIEKAAEDARWAEQVAAAKAKTTRKPRMATAARRDGDADAPQDLDEVEDPADGAEPVAEVVDNPPDTLGQSGTPETGTGQDEPADNDTDLHDVAALVKEAEDSGLWNLTTAARRVRRAVTDLHHALSTSERERQLRATIAVLTKHRDEAIQELKELTGRSGLPQSKQAAADTLTAEERGQCRAWAKENGMAAGMGRIPNATVIAWKEATGRAA